MEKIHTHSVDQKNAGTAPSPTNSVCIPQGKGIVLTDQFFTPEELCDLPGVDGSANGARRPVKETLQPFEPGKSLKSRAPADIAAPSGTASGKFFYP